MVNGHKSMAKQRQPNTIYYNYKCIRMGNKDLFDLD